VGQAIGWNRSENRVHVDLLGEASKSLRAAADDVLGDGGRRTRAVQCIDEDRSGHCKDDQQNQGSCS